MNFLSNNENSAFNVAFVKRLYVVRAVYTDAGGADEVYVTAELDDDFDDDSDVFLKTFDSADADKNYRAAQKFLAKLVGKLNEDYTNFILDRDGSCAVNITFVKQFAVKRVTYTEGETDKVHVTAETDDAPDVVLRIFDSADADKNYRAAQKFLAELVDKLNEDYTDFILDRDEICAVNVASVKQLYVAPLIYTEGDIVRVTAELDDDSYVVLKIFDSADTDENYRAAQEFLAELVAELNGGA